MPWVSKRALDELTAAMRRMRSAVREADADRMESAAERVAAIRSADQASDALEGARAVIARLQRDNFQLRRDNRGLRQQLDHALGYGAEELAAIEAGKTEPREKVVTA